MRYVVERVVTVPATSNLKVVERNSHRHGLIMAAAAATALVFARTIQDSVARGLSFEFPSSHVRFTGLGELGFAQSQWFVVNNNGFDVDLVIMEDLDVGGEEIERTVEDAERERIAGAIAEHISHGSIDDIIRDCIRGEPTDDSAGS